MTFRQIPPMMLARVPDAWPSAPEWMSFYKLMEVEQCPRRFSLRSAAYLDIWSGKGYPAKTTAAALVGQITHRALARLLSELADAGCQSTSDVAAIGVLKSLGGYSKLIQECTQSVLTQYEGHPRMAERLPSIRLSLDSRTAQMRSMLQILARRIRVPEYPVKIASSSRTSGRRTLGDGSHAEIELRVPQLHWLGIADLLLKDLDACEIIDFKTGEPAEEHKKQLKVYALLWTRDSELNPLGQRVTKLTLVYEGSQQSVDPPSETELAEIETDIRERSRIAREDLQKIPPPTRPAPGVCSFCEVKPLCADYWTNAVQARMRTKSNGSSPRSDLEVSVLDQVGPNSWNVRVRCSSVFEPGTTLIIMLRQPQFAVVFSPGAVLRIVDASTEFNTDDGSGRVATITGGSEVFLVPESAGGVPNVRHSS